MTLHIAPGDLWGVGKNVEDDASAHCYRPQAKKSQMKVEAFLLL